MKSILQLAAVLPLLIAEAAAQAVSCRTTLGTKSLARVPTTTITSTPSKRPTQVLLVQKTVTTYLGLISTKEATTTKTDTVTDTTDTDTFYVTSTTFEVSTSRFTTSFISTTTDTETATSTSTTVVPTNPGFLNIRDTLNRGSIARREPAHPHSPAKRAVLKGPQGVLAQSRANNVVCTRTMPNTNTYTSYTTIKAMTLTRRYWSRTITTTTTQTVTSTIIPDVASETITDTFTSSVQTTTTIINTQFARAVTTTTSVAPGPTVYNACNDQNIFGPVFRSGGSEFIAANVANNGPGVQSDFMKIQDGASTATECCNACQKMETCETFIFRKSFRNCFLLTHSTTGTCKNQELHPNFILSIPKGDDDGSAGYAVGNGGCGYTWSGETNGKVRPVDL
ncbi:Putative PAN/Apple domain-containing protein [Septoria linicola]|uniref:PAN/Apple domain-containing protein n=1 Tax=Septoria linicola TaxID=215465 RepID=A0A9Q9EIW9_9PEZI|nr:putative PAN/Apple domain-containing protein [Septoria linicola]USW51554.1 Putative PAN/Apple domain-containing protein [Septoria linicola]